MTPGYATDRDSGHPKSIHSGIRGLNNTFYHDSSQTQGSKPGQTTLSPPLHQIKTNTIDTESSTRNKYGGIKLISSSTNSGVKGR